LARRSAAHRAFSVWTARILSHLVLRFGRLIFFYLCPYLFRSLARGIAMALRCRHKPATAGIRSSATARARQASERRPTPLPDGRHILFVCYLLFTLSTFFLFSYCSLRLCSASFLDPGPEAGYGLNLAGANLGQNGSKTEVCTAKFWSAPWLDPVLHTPPSWNPPCLYSVYSLFVISTHNG
jgi:hypothetical protein